MKGNLLTTTAEAGKTLSKFDRAGFNHSKTVYIQVRPCIEDAFGNIVYMGKKSKAFKKKVK